MEEFAEKGFHLFAEMLLRPSFDTTAIEQVRRSMLGLLGRESQSPRSVARDLLVNHLYGETDPMARPISGDARSIVAISRDDLLNHHSRFYAPQNTILAISTSHPVEVALGWVERAFNLCGAEGEPALADREWTEYLGEPDEAHTDLESEQVSIYMGCFLPPPDHADAPVIRLATCILSDRLFNNLREKQGLAYSVGAGVEFDRTHGVFRCAIGTGSENYDRARQGLKLEIEKLKLDGPTKDELITARNQLLARIWTRRLSRINQAYYLAEAEHLGLKLGYQNEMAAALGAATASDIRRVMARYFDTEAMVVASAGTRP